MDLFFDNEFRKIIPPLQPKELQELEESLIKNGNIVPVVVWKEKKLLLDGHHRYDICQKHKIALKPAIEIPLPHRIAAMLWIIDNQLARRNLPPASRIELNIIRHDLIEKQKAKEKITAPDFHGNQYVSAPTQIVGEEQNKHENEVDTIIGEKAGVSRETVRRYRKVREKATPEQKEKLAKGNATVTQVYQQVHRDEVKEKVKTAKWPEGKYRVIYADPPWQYDNKTPVGSSQPQDYYPTIQAPSISELPVGDLALDDAVLFLWSPSPMLEESVKVINAWGFKYKASFVWDKVKHNMGNYNSVRHEFLLIAVRGSCQPESSKLYDSVQVIERKKHSAKPDEFRQIIDTLYPHGPRIELFATKKTPGWEVYGNQITSTISK